MARPHEETWEVGWDQTGGSECMRSAHELRVGDDVIAVFEADADRLTYEEDLLQGARARLAAQAPAMARLLVELRDWIDAIDDSRYSHLTDRLEYVDAVLRAAGVTL